MNQPRSVSDSSTSSSSKTEPSSSIAVGASKQPRARRLISACIIGLVAVMMWQLVGGNVMNHLLRLREESQAAEDNAPIGYIGLNPRRTYNDRAVVFLKKQDDGRTTLFAAKQEGGGPDDVYDVTEASIDMETLEGGFGRDSIPAIDYPIIETAEGERGRRLRKRQEVFGLAFDGGSRVYPRDMLERIELVNDRDGETSILIIYDRGRAKVFAFHRDIDGSTVSFGSTGYSRFKQPVLYDRKTKGVWVLDNDEFRCVAGSLKGRSIKPFRTLASMSWSEWIGQHPRTTIVVGNDRSKPIPTE